MRHRSISVLILLLATLAAVPEAAQEFSSFKSALGERVRAGIWSALLNLHAADEPQAATAPRLARANQSSAAHGAEATVARAEQRPETAVRTCPSASLHNDASETEARSPLGAQPAEVASATRELRDEGRAVAVLSPRDGLENETPQVASPALKLAMIIPPEQGLHPDTAPAASRLEAAPEEGADAGAALREAAARARQAAERHGETSYVAARLEARGVGIRLRTDETWRGLDELLRTRALTRGAQFDTLLKIRKLKRPVTPVAPAPPSNRKQDALSTVACLKAEPSAARVAE